MQDNGDGMMALHNNYSQLAWTSPYRIPSSNLGISSTSIGRKIASATGAGTGPMCFASACINMHSPRLRNKTPKKSGLKVVAAAPDVQNHNIETVPSLYNYIMVHHPFLYENWPFGAHQINRASFGHHPPWPRRGLGPQIQAFHGFPMRKRLG